MARVTVEDCVDKVPNRFDLVVLAAQRARQIAAGAPLTIERDNDKNPVVSLREIADETIDLQHLKDSSLWSFRRQLDNEEGDAPLNESDKPSFDLSLTGEVDDTEAALEAEFEAIENSMQIEDASPVAEQDTASKSE